MVVLARARDIGSFPARHEETRVEAVDVRNGRQFQLDRIAPGRLAFDPDGVRRQQDRFVAVAQHVGEDLHVLAGRVRCAAGLDRDPLVLAEQPREGQELDGLAPELRMERVARLPAKPPEILGPDEHGFAVAVALPGDERIGFRAVGRVRKRQQDGGSGLGAGQLGYSGQRLYGLPQPGGALPGQHEGDDPAVFPLRSYDGVHHVGHGHPLPGADGDRQHPADRRIDIARRRANGSGDHEHRAAPGFHEFLDAVELRGREIGRGNVTEDHQVVFHRGRGVFRVFSHVVRRDGREVGISLRHQELDFEARIAQQGPAQVAVLPARHAFHVKHLDLLVYDPNLVSRAVVGRAGLARQRGYLPFERSRASFPGGENQFLELRAADERHGPALRRLSGDRERQVAVFPVVTDGIELDAHWNLVAGEDDVRRHDPPHVDIGRGGKPDAYRIDGYSLLAETLGNDQRILALVPREIAQDHDAGDRLARVASGGLLHGGADSRGFARCRLPAQPGHVRAFSGAGPERVVETEEPHLVVGAQPRRQIDGRVCQGGLRQLQPRDGGGVLLQSPGLPRHKRVRIGRHAQRRGCLLQVARILAPVPEVHALRSVEQNQNGRPDRPDELESHGRPHQKHANQRQGGGLEPGHERAPRPRRHFLIAIQPDRERDGADRQQQRPDPAPPEEHFRLGQYLPRLQSQQLIQYILHSHRPISQAPGFRCRLV